ncbi:M42 family metallopeptidase [Feifania hominis]|uniref:M42 family metallopeptidase n=1 Tax=Feifania hominis TaxID=2763660 RepID=A0A926HU82_9FIRM|nr:M42 family metallopeptidase [Feifania hominis]MBC8535670.1 M42 family metallopeptidase [Feifania hominis]
MEWIVTLISELSQLGGVSGDESRVADYIEEKIRDFADDCRRDRLGNLIAFRKGTDSSKKLMLCAHMDEVGLLVSYITDEGLLRFQPVGGIDPRVITGRRVLVGEKQVPGVIGTKAIHIQTPEERKQAPGFDRLYIDIGATSREDAQKAVSLGDCAVFDSDFVTFGDGCIKAKALDNRVGCAVLMESMRMRPHYDTYYVFSVGEEVGLRGAYTSSYDIEPDFAVAIDSTTTADYAGVDERDQGLKLGGGCALFLMESTTYYFKDTLKKVRRIAQENGVRYQMKQIMVGGLDAGGIQRTASGVETASVATPCRYLHSPSCMMKISDILETEKLVAALCQSADLMKRRS